MALKDIGEGLEGWGWVGAAIGAAVLAPVWVPAVGRGLRPVAKGAIKGYLALSEKSRELFAETGEQFQDLVAEARAEYESTEGGAATMSIAQPGGEGQMAEGHMAEGKAGEGQMGEHAEERPRTRARRHAEPHEAAESAAGAPEARPQAA